MNWPTIQNLLNFLNLAHPDVEHFYDEKNCTFYCYIDYNELYGPFPSRATVDLVVIPYLTVYKDYCKEIPEMIQRCKTPKDRHSLIEACPPTNFVSLEEYDKKEENEVYEDLEALDLPF